MGDSNIRNTGPRPTLSVLMPVYNERATVRRIVEQVRSIEIPKEIIIVDDGSTDGTTDVLREIEKAHPDVTLVVCEKNRGKGAAVREAIRRAAGEICIIQDADLEYDPTDYAHLLEPIQYGETNVVYGSRILRRDNDYPLDHFLAGSLFFTTLTNVLFSGHLTDMPTCYKVFKTELLQSIPLRGEGFEFDLEVTTQVLKRGETILERPIIYRKRTIREGKKINWRDGVKWTFAILKYRFLD